MQTAFCSFRRSTLSRSCIRSNLEKVEHKMVQKEKRDTKRDKNDHNRGVGKYHIRVTVFTLRNLSFFSSKSANNFSTVTMISQTERKSH